MLLSQAINDFLADLAGPKQASTQTQKNYRHYLAHFLAFMSDILLEKLTLSGLKKYQHQLELTVDPKTNQLLKNSTQNYYLIALRSFIKYLAVLGLSTLEYTKINLQAQQAQPIAILDAETVDRLIQTPDLTDMAGLRDRAILELLYSTGMLVSELTSLDVAQINPTKNSVTLVGKGGHTRTVYLTESAHLWLLRYLSNRQDSYRPLFIRFQGRQESADDGQKMRLTTRSIERLVEKYAKQANLAENVTPHSLRHFLSHQLAENSTELAKVQKMLGHANIVTTKNYLKLATATEEV